MEAFFSFMSIVAVILDVIYLIFQISEFF